MPFYCIMSVRNSLKAGACEKMNEMSFVCENMSVFCVNGMQCPPGHSYAVGYTDRYLIHYIINGKGKVVCDGKTYHLTRGNAFLISGKEKVYYEADMKEPWHYIWIQISGSMADSFVNSVLLSRREPIYKTERPDIIEKRFRELTELENEKNNFTVSGAMFTLLGDMIKYSVRKAETDAKSPEEYVTMCKSYIQMNHYRRITVKELCSYVKLEHSYLYRLFMRETEMSPYDYIITYKLKTAKKLLKETALPIGEIALSVGYTDSLAFSKLFAKKVGIPPSEYRKAIVHGDEPR